eukprot:CAMPEP_0206527044 /NCGR_PEP_ID=MMETSP0325_2-20121206/1106_1 /ASSEMBLY_ACC=CAM_ASM_000347 /TAXON_ID=2866 /ORGANISM="Crypthecodinium cohnii, Strain Seligo" /LENGTH=613 /DNA_ID=CAMNT_0054022363 /DNA_START=31 /DNA_END=1872 /DNA_ORIENTATION=+
MAGIGLRASLSLLALGIASMLVKPCDANGLIRGPMMVGLEQAFLAGHNAEVSDNSLTIHHDAGVSAFTSSSEEWTHEAFMQLKLLGHSISFTVDLSAVGCACNLAFYLISGPAIGPNGTFDRGSDRQGQPPYYCDANKVGGQWCPEVDIMEANNHAFQATPHRCNAPRNGHYNRCDRNGCFQNTKDLNNSYGPSSNFTINTMEPFVVETSFPTNAAGELIGMRTVLRQASREVVLAHRSCNLNYMKSLTAAMADGMSLRITYWGGSPETMSWMDSPVCGDHQKCSGKHAGAGIIRDIRVDGDMGQLSTTPSPPTDIVQPDTPSQPSMPSSNPSSSNYPEGGVMWASDIYQSWMCYLETSPEQEANRWCVTAGIQDGYEYKYDGSWNSPCGCHCCRRQARAVLGALPAGDQQAYPMLPDIPSLGSVKVWVVSDPRDSRFGDVPPLSLTQDPSKFSHLGKIGVVNWDGEHRIVKFMSQDRINVLAKEGASSGFRFFMQKDLVANGIINFDKVRTIPAPVAALIALFAVIAATSVGVWRYRSSTSAQAASLRSFQVLFSGCDAEDEEQGRPGCSRGGTEAVCPEETEALASPESSGLAISGVSSAKQSLLQVQDLA